MIHRVCLVAPHPLDQRTGGYLYDRHMMDGLAQRGWRVVRQGARGRFPDPDDTARASVSEALAGQPDGSRVVIDGLAMAGQPEPVAAHADRLRIVALVHHPVAEETGLDPQAAARLGALEARALAAATGVIVTSPFTGQVLIDRYGVDPACVRVAVPGTDRAASAARPAPGDPLQLLVVASVTRRKGHDVLVRALARLRHRAWRCVCAGSLDRAPTFARDVRAAVEGAGLADRIRLVGECDPETLERLYAGSSIFVLPSHYEGYGMVLAEALAHGLPVVSTTGGAIPSTVPGDAGLLCAPGDDQALAAALATLLDDDARRRSMAAAARRHGEALSGWSDAAVVFERCLLGLTADGSADLPDACRSGGRRVEAGVGGARAYPGEGGDGARAV